jgi:hypothetical protein
MRRLETSVYNMMMAGNYYTFLAFEVGPWPLDGSFTRYTTLSDTITIADRLNDRTSDFLPNMPLVSIDPPASSSTLDKNTFKVTLADPELAFKPLLEGGGVGTPMWVRAGLIDHSTVHGDFPTIPNNVLLPAVGFGEHGTFCVYKGAVDRYVYTITENGETILTFEGASPAAALELKRDITTSRFWMRSHYPSDSSFDNVYKGSAQQTLQWGKGPPPKQKKRGGIFGKLFG